MQLGMEPSQYSHTGGGGSSRPQASMVGRRGTWPQLEAASHSRPLHCANSRPLGCVLQVAPQHDFGFPSGFPEKTNSQKASLTKNGQPPCLPHSHLPKSDQQRKPEMPLPAGTEGEGLRALGCQFGTGSCRHASKKKVVWGYLESP